MTDKKTVLILPGCTDTDAVEMFERRGWDADLWVGDDLDDRMIEYDAICFMGGTDVDPAIYGEERGPTTQSPDKKRDTFEVAVFEMFKDTDVYLFGICRGAQLLNVLNGGQMVQECGYRGGEADIVLSPALRMEMGLSVNHVAKHNVCHHQGMISGDGVDRAVVAAYDDVSDDEILDYVIHYPETRSYGVQGHPEWGHKETEDLFFAGIDLVMDFEDTSGLYPLKKGN